MRKRMRETGDEAMAPIPACRLAGTRVLGAGTCLTNGSSAVRLHPRDPKYRTICEPC